MKRIVNKDSITHTWVGQIITPDSTHTIEPNEEVMWSNDTTLLIAIANGLAVVNDGTDDILDINQAIIFLKGDQITVDIAATSNIRVTRNLEANIIDGKVFSVDHVYMLQNAATHDHAIVTPDTTTYAHLYYVVESSQDVEIMIYEAPTLTVGAEVVPINRNRNSTYVNTTKIYDFSNLTAVGTIISHRRFGMGQGTGNNITTSSTDDELILKRNTKYLIRIRSNSNGNILSTSTRWYEQVSTGG